MQPLVNKFHHFLTGGKKLSPSSIKNYVSDINRFLTWLAQSLQISTVKPSQITKATLQTYRHYLIQTANQTTANRHLASLRRFGLFLSKTGLSTDNPSKNLANVDVIAYLGSHPQSSIIPENNVFKTILRQYRRYLKKQKLSKSTVKNYLSDLNQYLIWAQTDTKTTDSKLVQRSLK